MEKTFKFGKHGEVNIQKALELSLKKQLKFRKYICKTIFRNDMTVAELSQYLSLLLQADKDILACLSEINKKADFEAVAQSQHECTVDSHELAETLKRGIQSEMKSREITPAEVETLRLSAEKELLCRVDKA